MLRLLDPQAKKNRIGGKRKRREEKWSAWRSKVLQINEKNEGCQAK